MDENFKINDRVKIKYLKDVEGVIVRQRNANVLYYEIKLNSGELVYFHVEYLEKILI
jgi:hypothetical protein